MDETKKQLRKAKSLYDSKKYDEALEIYEKQYSENPEKFDIWAKRFYGWSIYYSHIKYSGDEEELTDYTELITQLLRQADLNRDPTCAYTLCVIKVMDYYYRLKEYDELLKWMEKLNPKLLDDNKQKYEGRTYPSKKEKYYNYITKAYYELQDYDACIEWGKKGLEAMDTFANSSDTWYKWRIAKSLNEIAEYDEAIKYLKEVSEVKKDWYVYKEIADSYYFNSDLENFLKYSVEAALKLGDTDKKVKLYPIIRDLIKNDYPEEALKHDYLVYTIRNAHDWGNEDALTERIEESGLDLENKNYKAIEKELKPFWVSLKYKNQERKYGTVTKIFEHGKSGFISSENNESYYFSVRDIVKGRKYLREYASVTFYTEKSFDKSKNKASTVAVNIEVN